MVLKNICYLQVDAVVSTRSFVELDGSLTSETFTRLYSAVFKHTNPVLTDANCQLFEGKCDIDITTPSLRLYSFR